MSEQRVVVITGTSSGIGLHTAVAAARAGWRVVATMRDPNRGDRLRAAASDAGVELDIRALDVVVDGAPKRVLDDVVADHGRLDALINNAGAGAVGTVELLSMDDIRSAMELNYFAVVAATRAALPHLRGTGGRVLTVTSVGGIVGQPFSDAYCAAKFAVEGAMESLQPVAATVGVGVAVIEPAAVASDFVRNAVVDPAPMIESAGPYAPALTNYFARTEGAYANAQTSEDAAAVVAGALDLNPLPLRIQTGESARRFAGLKLADLDGSAVTGYTRTWVE